MRITFMSVLMLLLLLPVSAGATSIPFANLDFGADGQEVEPGAVGITAAATTGILAADGSTFDLSIDDSVGGFGFRNRITGNGDPLVRVAQDMVKSGSSLEFTFSGLSAGTYEVTGYFMDAQNNQFDNIAVTITDANGAGVSGGIVGDASMGSEGIPANLTTTLVMDTSVSGFSFVSNGTDDVVLLFDAPTNTTAGIEIPVSGLFIQHPIPEPTGIAIVSLLGLMVSGCRWRR